jgi:hypothetical protein
MTVSPLDGKLYISDYESRRIIQVKTMGRVRALDGNFEVIAGNGEQCLPGEKEKCGDGGPASQARLMYPKGKRIYSASARISKGQGYRGFLRKRAGSSFGQKGQFASHKKKL